MKKRTIDLLPGKKIYFASDFHLGAPNHKKSREREIKIIQWLNEIKTDAQEIFILGDVFDFWYEYKTVVPRGFIRFLGKISEIIDSGIPVTFFKGNHDMWMRNYLVEELNIEILDDVLELEINDTTFQIGHGDGLGPGDSTYKLLRKVFRSGWAQWIFTRFHPNFSFWIANSWSGHSRLYNDKDRVHLGEKEMLYQYCLEQEKTGHRDYYLFGHRHLPMEFDINENSKYYNLGEWINYFTYGVFDGKVFQMAKFEN